MNPVHLHKLLAIAEFAQWRLEMARQRAGRLTYFRHWDDKGLIDADGAARACSDSYQASMKELTEYWRAA